MVAKLNVVAESSTPKKSPSIQHLQNIKGCVERLSFVGAIRLNSPAPQSAPSVSTPTDIVKQHPKAAVLLCDIEDETFSGKIASLKLLCALLDAPELPAKTRYATLPGIARDLLSERLEKMDYGEIELIYTSLVNKVCRGLSNC